MAVPPGSETRALKHYIADTLSGASEVILSGTQWNKVAIYAQRPKRQTEGNTVFISVGNVRRRTKRIGMGRPSGLKRHEYDVDLIIEATCKDEQAGQDDFDQVFDQVDIAIEQVLIAATITDPDTTQQYAVSNIGEEIEGHVLEPTMTAPQGEVTLTAQKSFTAWINYND